MKLILQSQYRENYGAHSWDGTGACPQYWKNKGGREYSADIDPAYAASLGNQGLGRLACMLAVKYVNQNDDYSEESMIDWNLIGDNELSPYQKAIGDESYMPDVTPLPIGYVIGGWKC